MKTRTDPMRTVTMAPYVAGLPTFRLEIFGRDARNPTGQWEVGHRLTEVSPDGGETVIFDTESGEHRPDGEPDAASGVSPMHAIDSVEAVRGVLGWLVLQPGDTDPEFFEDYTERQLAFAREHGEILTSYTLEDDPQPFDTDDCRDDAEGCDCGSHRETTYNPVTNGFDCSECRDSVVVHEDCGTAFYTHGPDAECDVCGKR